MRPKDVVHLEVLDQVGFITPELEESLPGVLRARLELARQQFDTQEDIKKTFSGILSNGNARVTCVPHSLGVVSFLQGIRYRLKSTNGEREI